MVEVEDFGLQVKCWILLPGLCNWHKVFRFWGSGLGFRVWNSLLERLRIASTKAFLERLRVLCD